MTAQLSKLEYRTYRVRASDREPLLDFMLDALRGEGCRILYSSSPKEAPFRITFETPQGERLGIVAYAFLANSRETKNRPADEHRFQLKYGSEDGKLHELWQDPFGLYTTLLLGINTEHGFFVGYDPVLHNPTKFFISLEFKQRDAEQILKKGWHSWERERKRAREEPVEVVVGGTPGSFLPYIQFEREALGEDQGHRQLIAEKALRHRPTAHLLSKEFELSEREVLDLIESAHRLSRGLPARCHGEMGVSVRTAQPARSASQVPRQAFEQRPYRRALVRRPFAGSARSSGSALSRAARHCLPLWHGTAPPMVRHLHT